MPSSSHSNTATTSTWQVNQIAQAARVMFQGMPRLHQKTFAVKPEMREAVNVYLWENEAAARAFFTAEMLDRVTELVWRAPTIEYRRFRHWWRTGEGAFFRRSAAGHRAPAPMA